MHASVTANTLTFFPSSTHPSRLAHRARHPTSPRSHFSSESLLCLLPILFFLLACFKASSATFLPFWLNQKATFSLSLFNDSPFSWLGYLSSLFASLILLACLLALSSFFLKFIQDSPFSGGQILQSQGLVSIDRSMVAALLSTTPRLAPRSSANDLAPQHCTVMGMVSAGEAGDSFVPQHALGPSRCGSSTAFPEYGTARIVASQRRGTVRYRCVSGPASDLEAFSHNPSDGSLAPLAGQPSTCTKCPNLRFLSY